MREMQQTKSLKALIPTLFKLQEIKLHYLEKGKKNLSKGIKVEVGEKEYTLGYPTRKDAINAEINGLDITNAGKVLILTETLFFTGLLAKQPEITRTQAVELLEQYIAEGGETEEITQFLINEYVAFTKSPDGKKKKKAKIVEMQIVIPIMGKQKNIEN